MKVTKTEITISNQTIARLVIWAGVIVLAIKFLAGTTHPLQLIFVAFFLSLALSPAVNGISRRLHLKSRAAATGLAYLLVLLFLAVFVTTVVPPLARQTVSFVRDAPTTLNSLKTEDSTAGRFVRKYHLQDDIDGLSTNLSDRTKNLREPVITTAGKVGSTLISILAILALTFMMLVEGPSWLSRLLSLQPAEKRDHYRQLAKRMYRVITGYVNGQVLLALIGAGFDFVALVIASTVLNVSVNAVALAGIIAVTGLIPMIGHTIGASLVVLACLFVSVPLAIVMAIIMVVYQQLENITIQPYIQAKYNELTPLLVFIAALVGISFGGLLGGFVAIPAAGCARVLFLDYYERKHGTTKLPSAV